MAPLTNNTVIDIAMLDIKKILIVVGIVLLSSLEAKIDEFVVWRPTTWNFQRQV